MLNKLHPNSRTAWMLVALTVMMSAGVVALMQFAATGTNSRILFTQFDGNDYEVFVMDSFGNVAQLTDNNMDDWGAAWSPDYSQIAFRSMRDGYSRIYVMNADGSDARPVTPTMLYAGSWGYAGMPAWAPDGNALAFEAVDITRSADYDIYVLDLNTQRIDKVTTSTANDWHPDFSPDGQQIAFSREAFGMDCYSTCDIYVMNADGTNERRYTYSSGMDVFPQWSPDGSQILFHSERTGNSDIFVMNADGSMQQNVTNTPTLERVARWSANGNSIVFRSERDGDSDIYVFDLNTRETTIKTHNNLDDRYPDW